MLKSFLKILKNFTFFKKKIYIKLNFAKSQQAFASNIKSLGVLSKHDEEKIAFKYQYQRFFIQ